MYHLVDNFQDKAGNALVGYYVKLRVPGGAYATLYADENLTPIVSVSGVADTAVTDANGMYDLFVNDGTYDVEFFDRNDINQRIFTVSSVPMFGNVTAADLVSAVSAAEDAAAAAQAAAASLSPYATRTALAAAGNTATALDDAYLTEAGARGKFIFDASDLSAEVTLDTQQGIYVPPTSDATGASGAWVRVVSDNTYQAAWWGVGSANNATNHTRIAAALAAIPAGATLVLPNEAFAVQGVPGNNSVIRLTKPIHLTGGPETEIDCSAIGSVASIIVVLASNVEVSGFGLTGHHITRGADPWFNIFIGSRFRYISESVEIENVTVHDMRISDGSCGIAIHHAVWQEGGVQVDYSPTNVKVFRNIITGMDYRGIAPEGQTVEVYNNVVEMDTTVAYADVGHTAFRIIGCDDVNIHDNYVVPHPSTPAFLVTGSGIDGAHQIGVATWFKDVQDLNVHHNNVVGKCSAAIQIEWMGRTVMFDHNRFDADLTATDSHRIFIFLGNNNGVRQGELYIRNNTARGFNNFLTLTAGYFKSVFVEGNRVLGNSKSGAQFEVTSVSCANGSVAGMDFFQFHDNTHIVSQTLVTWPIHLVSMQSGTFSFHGNTLPEVNGAFVNSINIENPVSVNYRSDVADAFTTITVSTQAIGTNRRWPAGTHALAIDDIAASPRETAIP